MENIRKKTLEIKDKYKLTYKEAEYLACRLIAKQSIDHIKERLASKLSIIQVQFDKLSCMDNLLPRQNMYKSQLEIGIKKYISLVKFLKDKGGDTL